MIGKKFTSESVEVHSCKIKTKTLLENVLTNFFVNYKFDSIILNESLNLELNLVFVIMLKFS